MSLREALREAIEELIEEHVELNKSMTMARARSTSDAERRAYALIEQIPAVFQTKDEIHRTGDEDGA